MSTNPPHAPEPAGPFPAGDPLSAQLRAADRDREHAAGVLAGALATGRLTVVEHAERLEAAFAAKTVGELRGLVSDLPATRPLQARRRPLPNRPSRRMHAGRMAGPWSSWLVTALICFTIWAATSIAQADPVGFWPGWVIGPWGAVLLATTVPRGTGGQPRRCLQR